MLSENALSVNMYSSKWVSEYGQRRPPSDRRSKPWGPEDREAWTEPARASVKEPYMSYGGDGRDWSERASERASSSDYGEAYSREFTSDTDWRKRRTSSGELSEKRRRTLELEDENRFRHQHKLNEAYRLSPETYSQRNKDFNPAAPVEDNRRYGSHQDHTFSQFQDEPPHKPAPEFFKDRDSRDRSRSPTYTKTYTPPRPRSDRFLWDQDDLNHNLPRFSLNGSGRLPEQSPRRRSPPPLPPPAAAAREKKMSKGFQRFLDVLNMGVNVETLTQIVTQGSPDQSAPRPTSPRRDRPWTAAEQSPGHRDPQYWPPADRGRTGSQTYRTLSSNGRTGSEEGPAARRSPLTIDAARFDLEHKHKQMYDVLQAIGIKLEFEELGQMSSRIQERLYGKKPANSSPASWREEAEREARRRPAYSPKRRSRSSSASSSSASSRDYRRSPSYDAHRDELMDKKFSRYETDRHRTQPSPQKYPQQTDRPSTQPSALPSPIAQPPPSVKSSLLPLPPAHLLNHPPPPFPHLPPGPPPSNLLNMFVSHPPPFLPPFPPPMPLVPPANAFPKGPGSFPAFPQQQNPGRWQPYQNLVTVPTAQQHQNFTKSKTEPKQRKRFLQVVPTKK